MNKKMKRTATLAMATLLLTSSLTACGGGGGIGGGSKETLTITVSDIGFGTNFLYEIADEFERMYDVTVEITPTVIAADLLNQLESDYQLDDVCMFGGVACWEQIRSMKMMNIDDVWNSVPETDEGTAKIVDKVIPEYAVAYKMPDDHYYSMPWTVELSVMNYNKTTLDNLFGANGWKLPRTTMELTALAEAVKAKEHYAFTWSSKTPYWGGLEEVWTAQYDGAETYTNYKQGYIYDDEKSEYVVDKEAKSLELKGRLRAYQVEFPLMSKKGGLTHTYATSMDFAQSQAAFVGVAYANDKKSVAFTPSGNWVYEESLEDIEHYAQDIGCMNAPIISALSEKLSYYGNAGDYEALSNEDKAKFDKALCAIIDYVDGVSATKPTEVEGLTITDADIERVAEARNIARLKDQAAAFIPHNAQNPELAKKFLKFFASDYAGQLYSSVTHGFSPYYLKVDATNNFLKDYDKTAAAIVSNADNIILNYAKTGFSFKTLAVDEFFFDKVATPEEFYTSRYQADNKKTWSNILANAGLIKS